MSTPPELMRRLDRKLDIRRGMSLSYDDLALLVASGAYAKLQDATREYQERQCLEHAAQNPSTSGAITPCTDGPAETSKSSGMIGSENGSEALARAQTTLRVVESPSTSTTSRRRAANTFPPQTGAVR